MTEMKYEQPIESFKLDVTPAKVFEVDIMKDGRKALSDVNQSLGK